MNQQEIEQAAKLLKQGRLVAFPTETVYGLGADARSEKALAELYRVKGRPTDHPVIVHLATPDWIPRFALADQRALALAQRFWPGPLTMILKRKPDVPDAVTGSQDTVGLRMPSHPVALRLLNAFGNGLAAPSANRFGKVSPTTAEHVRLDLGHDVAMVLDGGPCDVGVESTIVDLTTDTVKILRPGAITATQLREVLSEVEHGQSKTRAPGTLESHYAPATQSELVAPEHLQTRLHQLKGQRVAVWSATKPEGAEFWLEAEKEATDYARTLYSNLRQLDAGDYDFILIEEPPAGEQWTAATDRLKRATA